MVVYVNFLLQTYIKKICFIVQISIFLNRNTHDNYFISLLRLSWVLNMLLYFNKFRFERCNSKITIIVIIQKDTS